MKIRSLAFTLCLALPISVSCAGPGGGAQSSASVNKDAIPDLPRNTGPKAVVVVKPFQWGGGGSKTTIKSGDQEWEFSVQDRQEFGMELSKLLEQALTKSTYFAVAPRDVLDLLEKEGDLDKEGKTDLSTGTEDGGLVRPDMILAIYVQEFNPKAGGESMAGGVLASLTKSVAGVAVSHASEAGRVVLQVQLINRRTGITISDEMVEGYAESSGFTVGGFGLGGGALAGGALSKWEDKPMGAAIRKAVALSVVEIHKNTPKKFYTYDG